MNKPGRPVGRRVRLDQGRIIRRRTELGMTQRQVADAMGVRQQAVAQLENGTGTAIEATANRLAAVLGLTPLEVIAGEVKPQAVREYEAQF